MLVIETAIQKVKTQTVKRILHGEDVANIHKLVRPPQVMIFSADKIKISRSRAVALVK